MFAWIDIITLEKLHIYSVPIQTPGLSSPCSMANQSKDPLKPKISDSNMKKSQVSIDIEPLEIVARTVIKEDNICKNDELSFAIC